MVSVIYLNFNRKNDLYRSLKEVFKQDFDDFEVIVIDQNSTDGSIEMIEQNYPNVNLTKLSENLGVAGGRNYGAKMAKGDYLIFIDDDAELIDYGAVRRVSLIFDNNIDVNIIAFNIVGHPEIIEKTKYFSLKKDNKVNYYIGCGHSIRKKAFNQLGGYSENLFFWGEEIELAIKSFSIPKNVILYKGDIILYHRISAVQRLHWKSGRFYYKVRNRMYILHNLLPLYTIPFYKLYYIIAYLIRAIQLSELDQYFKALKDYKSLNKTPLSQRLHIKDWLRYIYL